MQRSSALGAFWGDENELFCKSIGPQDQYQLNRQSHPGEPGIGIVAAGKINGHLDIRGKNGAQPLAGHFLFPGREPGLLIQSHRN